MDTEHNHNTSSSDNEQELKRPDLLGPVPPPPPPPVPPPPPPPPPPPMSSGPESNDLLSFEDESCVNHTAEPLQPQAAFLPPGFEPLSFEDESHPAPVMEAAPATQFDPPSPGVDESFPAPESDDMSPGEQPVGMEAPPPNMDRLPPEAEKPQEEPQPEVVPPPPSMDMMPSAEEPPPSEVETLPPAVEPPPVESPSPAEPPPAEELPPVAVPPVPETETPLEEEPQSGEMDMPNGFEPSPHTMTNNVPPTDPEPHYPEEEQRSSSEVEESHFNDPDTGACTAEPDTLPLVLPHQMDSDHSSGMENSFTANGLADSGMETSPAEVEDSKPCAEVTMNGRPDSGMEISPVEVETAPCGKESLPFDIENRPPAYETDTYPPTWMDSEKQSEVEPAPVPVPPPPALAMVDVPPVDYDVIEDEGQATTVVMMEEKEDREPTCCERCLRCLSHVPCGSLISWIILVLGLGSLAGSALIGTRKTRALLQDDRLLWFMELTVTGVVVSMFVLGTCFLIVGHVSSDPTSRCLFNTTSKNTCARGFNTFVLVLVYFLCLCWLLASTVLTAPIVLLVLMFLVTGRFEQGECLDLQNYGFPARQICSPELMTFKEDAQDILICFGVTLVAVILVIISLIHFLICVSANITHLRDNRFATLNAYDETEESRNSKHSMLDTNM